MATVVRASPATLQTGMQVETRDTGHVTIQALTSKLTPAGIIAVLDAVNTYLSGLSTANRNALFALIGDSGLKINAGFVHIPCRTADAATFSATLVALLKTSANVTAG